MRHIKLNLVVFQQTLTKSLFAGDGARHRDGRQASRIAKTIDNRTGEAETSSRARSHLAGSPSKS